MKVFERIKLAYQQNLPFVVYRKSNKSTVSGFFQKTDELFYMGDFSNNGFVFAPFDNQHKGILIPENQSEFVQEKIVFNTESDVKTGFKTDFSSKENHIKLVEKGVEAIHQNQFNKVVLSRKEVVELDSFDLENTYKRLLQNYPNAFVYVWFHPKVGLWLGATPETLVKINNGQFETMSLAGTQPYKNSVVVNWNQKEIDEQQIVTDYIVSNLQSSVESLEIGKVETVKAGNLLHLKTKITGELKTQNSKLITSILHPTPAVCGMPLETSKKFILENENYNRSFYTGFLGELNLDNKSELYVNLRCMEIEENKASIYIGGGITKDSNPEKEWEETIAKAKVMKKVL